ncbi:glycosyltransferase [Microbacterium sp. X-17]|uniref:glycosyltransferase n=1 Tax=Microbacterium sp. X-17 TaxID=3144404 RepID=UPI0031F4A6AD
MSHQLLLDISIIFSLVAGTVFLGYVVTIILPFVRRTPDEHGDPAAFEWHFVVPCRDEEAVIGETVGYLRETFPEATVWVIDDDSEDATADIVRRAASDLGGVELIQRRRPNARTGKAHALNHAWSIIRETIPAERRATTVLAVVDADGRPSANLLEVAAGPELFGSDEIGAVQVEVRMSNRVVMEPLEGRGRFANLVARTFVRMQDLEFRGPISAIQMSRRYTGTVNVGGNGQLTRLSALDAIAEGEGPWRGSLLEDFELGLHFLLGGWKNAYTTAAWVDQEALYSLRRYIVQRARWSQGTMQCFRYIPKIWGSSRLGNLGAMELTYFLLQPWVQVLGTIFYPIPVIAMIVNAVTDGLPRPRRRLAAGGLRRDRRRRVRDLGLPLPAALRAGGRPPHRRRLGARLPRLRLPDLRGRLAGRHPARPPADRLGQDHPQRGDGRGRTARVAHELTEFRRRAPGAAAGTGPLGWGGRPGKPRSIVHGYDGRGFFMPADGVHAGRSTTTHRRIPHPQRQISAERLESPHPRERHSSGSSRSPAGLHPP